MKTWSKRKQAYLVVYARGINHQCVGATGKPFSQSANLIMLPVAHDVMDAFTGLLDKLALVATTNRTTVQQLTLANLLLTMSVATLTAANKKLTKMVACYNPAPQRCGNKIHRGPKAIWGNYCWTHGYKVLHTSKPCNVIGRKPGHDEDATVVDTKGGVDFNKDWYLQGNCAP